MFQRDGGRAWNRIQQKANIQYKQIIRGHESETTSQGLPTQIFAAAHAPGEVLF
jgi:hypothetical protein